MFYQQLHHFLQVKYRFLADGAGLPVCVSSTEVWGIFKGQPDLVKPPERRDDSATLVLIPARVFSSTGADVSGQNL